MAKTEPIRVLIVDGNPDIRDGLRSILQAISDIDVVGEATDGSQAISEVERLSPQVVLMDAQMEGVDGIEATRRIKDLSPHVKIILLAAHSGYLEDALAAGVDTYLFKDCGRHELQQAIRGLVRRE